MKAMRLIEIIQEIVATEGDVEVEVAEYGFDKLHTIDDVLPVSQEVHGDRAPLPVAVIFISE